MLNYYFVLFYFNNTLVILIVIYVSFCFGICLYELFNKNKYLIAVTVRYLIISYIILIRIIDKNS